MNLEISRELTTLVSIHSDVILIAKCCVYSFRHTIFIFLCRSTVISYKRSSYKVLLALKLTARLFFLMLKIKYVVYIIKNNKNKMLIVVIVLMNKCACFIICFHQKIVQHYIFYSRRIYSSTFKTNFQLYYLRVTSSILKIIQLHYEVHNSQVFVSVNFFLFSVLTLFLID